VKAWCGVAAYPVDIANVVSPPLKIHGKVGRRYAFSAQGVLAYIVILTILALEIASGKKYR